MLKPPLPAIKRAILIHYHEIQLKGGNRGWFESRLQQHVSAVLKGLPHAGIQRFGGRMAIGLTDQSPAGEIARRLETVFGIANLAVAYEVSAEYDAIRSTLGELVAGRTFATFKIDARRGTKEFPMNSQQLNRELGGLVQNLTGAAVRMNQPELTCFLEIVGRRAFLYFDKIAGEGGLPSQTGGRVLCLLSGGIDSPVAAYRMMRRGCQVRFVHFHSFPHTTLESQEKTRRIAAILARYQLESRLHLVPFAEVQREIVAYAPAALRVVLYRRFMVRIAERIAENEKAAALVTGDSLGQVASQTLENLRSVSAAARLPIFRPLIGNDKEEIMDCARRIGTYDISIMPDQDCCSLFVPRHPETMSSIAQVEGAERGLDLSRLLAQALEAATAEVILPDFSASAARQD